MKTNLSILFWKFVRRLIVRSYGDDCFIAKEYEDTCAGCRAARAMEFIDEHIDLLEWDKEQNL